MQHEMGKPHLLKLSCLPLSETLMPTRALNSFSPVGVTQGSYCASEPTQFDGKLDGDSGVNIMTSAECKDAASCG